MLLISVVVVVVGLIWLVRVFICHSGSRPEGAMPISTVYRSNDRLLLKHISKPLPMSVSVFVLIDCRVFGSDKDSPFIDEY